MSCHRFERALKEHAAGAALPQDARTHVGGCAECRSLLEREQRLIAMIQADLSAALAIEPSPELGARVRQRVADGTRDARGAFGWRFALGTAAAIVLGVSLTVTLRERTNDPIVPPQRPVAAQAIPKPIGPHAPPTAATLPVSPVAGHRVEHRRRVAALSPVQSRTSDPEVLVPSDQRIAVARLLALTRAGQLDARMLPPARPPALDEHSAAWVAPIVVENVNVPAILSADGSIEKTSGRN